MYLPPSSQTTEKTIKNLGNGVEQVRLSAVNLLSPALPVCYTDPIPNAPGRPRHERSAGRPRAATRRRPPRGGDRLVVGLLRRPHHDAQLCRLRPADAPDLRRGANLGPRTRLATAGVRRLRERGVGGAADALVSPVLHLQLPADHPLFVRGPRLLPDRRPALAPGGHRPR